MTRRDETEQSGSRRWFYSGYSMYKMDSAPWEGAIAEILLPIELKRILVEERQERLAAKIREEGARIDRARNAAPPPAPQPSAGAILQDGTFAKVFEHGIARRNKRKQHPVVSAREVLRVADLVARCRDKEQAKRDSLLLDKIKASGPLRAVANPIFDPSRWAASRERLMATHPHFGEVIDLVASYVECSARSTEPLVIPPLLLWGEPGIGKTRYSQDLAQALTAPLRRQSMENAQSTSLLLGTERHWSTAGPGVIFEEIVLGQFANPVFLLDELDKAPIDGRYDPLAALHCLLEPLTAKNVRDAGLDIEFDASLATYIATANVLRRIPSSLLSRFRQFEIQAPRGEFALQVARSIVDSTIRSRAVPGFAIPGHALAHRLAHLTAREISQAVGDAVARAVSAGRTFVKEEDFPSDILETDRSRAIH